MRVQVRHPGGRIVVAIALLAGLSSGLTEVVYSNLGSADSEPAYFPSLVEYGDEVRLSGIGREVIQFRTEYFADLTTTNPVMARIRFYANDGPGRYRTPGTPLFESDPIGLTSGYNTITLADISITVPEVFTWTIEFRGLSGAIGQRAGLLLYDPPLTGFSYNDFWMRTGTNWALFHLATGVKANYAARIVARDVLTVQLEAPRRSPGGTRMQLTGLIGRTCVVQASTNLTQWKTVGVFEFAKNREEFIDTNAQSSGPCFYRALSTVGGPMRFAHSLLTTNGLTTLQIIGPERHRFVLEGSRDLVNWSVLTTNTFGSRPVVVVFPESRALLRRFYRTRLLP